MHLIIKEIPNNTIDLHWFDPQQIGNFMTLDSICPQCCFRTKFAMTVLSGRLKSCCHCQSFFGTSQASEMKWNGIPFSAEGHKSSRYIGYVSWRLCHWTRELRQVRKPHINHSYSYPSRCFINPGWVSGKDSASFPMKDHHYINWNQPTPRKGEHFGWHTWLSK